MIEGKCKVMEYKMKLYISFPDALFKSKIWNYFNIIYLRNSLSKNIHKDIWYQSKMNWLIVKKSHWFSILWKCILRLPVLQYIRLSPYEVQYLSWLFWLTHVACFSYSTCIVQLKLSSVVLDSYPLPFTKKI